MAKKQAIMRVSLLKRTTKKDGKMYLRFRVRVSDRIEMYHKSKILAWIKDVENLDTNGNKRAGVSKMMDATLPRQVQREISIIQQAYDTMTENGMTMNSEVLEQEIQKILSPTATAFDDKDKSLLVAFAKYFNDRHAKGKIGEHRFVQYEGTYKVLERFLIVRGLTNITAAQFTSDNLRDLESFIKNEYLYVDKWHGIYCCLPDRDIPKQERMKNTVVTRLKMLATFFTYLEDNEKIHKSPFRKLGDDKKDMLHENKPKPIFLKADEFNKLLHTDVPKSLQQVKDCFCLQCTLGARVSDFSKFTINDIKVDKSGIAYIHYVPEKTKKESVEEIETPLLAFALDIVKRYNFDFPILKYISGERGYNKKIKTLLQYCGMDRECKQYDEIKGEWVFKPLYEFGSSKTARKTFVDIMNKIQINKYAAGLHSEHSKAVDHYTELTLQDRFILMCAAFDEKPYKVDESLNIIK